MKVNKNQLSEALSRCRSVLTSRPPVELLRNFCFRGQTVSATDGALAVVTGWPLMWDCCIDAERFGRIVDALPDDPDLAIVKDRVKISAACYRAELGTSSAKAYPSLIPQDLQDFYCGDDLVRLTNAVLLPDKASGPDRACFEGVGIRDSYVYATDGDRVSRARLSGKVKAPVAIQGRAVKLLARFGEPKKVSMSAGRLVAFYPEHETVVAVPLLASRFPYDMIDGVLGRRADPTLSAVLPRGFSHAVTRVWNLTNGKSSQVLQLENTPTGLRVAVEAEVGTAEEVLAWDFQHPFAVKVRAEYLLEAVKRTDRVNLTNVVSGEGRNLWFRNEGFEHVVALSI